MTIDRDFSNPDGSPGRLTGPLPPERPRTVAGQRIMAEFGPGGAWFGSRMNRIILREVLALEDEAASPAPTEGAAPRAEGPPHDPPHDARDCPECDHWSARSEPLPEGYARLSDGAVARVPPGWSKDVENWMDAAIEAAPLDPCNCACMECGGSDDTHCLQCATEGAAPRAEGPQVTTRGNLAQALLATEMIDRLLDYAKTGEDRQQVAWSWANRIADWLVEREAASPALDVRSPEFREAVRSVFEAPGEDFGPARGYYGGDIDHFIDMLAARLTPEPSE